MRPPISSREAQRENWSFSPPLAARPEVGTVKKPKTAACPNCLGEGQIEHRGLSDGKMVYWYTICGMCEGSGEVPAK